MTLTVRLDEALASALESHCAARGISQSLVVRRSLAAYLLAQRRDDLAADGELARPIGDNLQAFRVAGLVGAVAIELDGSGSADKSAVRKQMTSRLALKALKARPPGP